MFKLYPLNHKKKIKREIKVYISHLIVMEKPFKRERENLRKKDLFSSKQLFILVDMNISLLDYVTKSNVENFFNIPLGMEYSQLLQNQQK